MALKNKKKKKVGGEFIFWTFIKLYIYDLWKFLHMWYFSKNLFKNVSIKFAALQWEGTYPHLRYF